MNNFLFILEFSSKLKERLFGMRCSRLFPFVGLPTFIKCILPLKFTYTLKKNLKYFAWKVLFKFLPWLYKWLQTTYRDKATFSNPFLHLKFELQHFSSPLQTYPTHRPAELNYIADYFVLKLRLYIFNS